ncbi:CheR family methyltransferase [Methylocystis echinoides]|uniref:CheR family methyltransferase n=1 Tax=Methylocystis echinoides TaxID=29468 RepID=UPI00342C8B63
MNINGEGNDLRPLHTPVCAIGASAGGVNALQAFFATVSNDLGLAFVVVVHLAPDHPSALSEILATRTTMPVRQVEVSEKLKPNCVYVVAPDRELVIDGDDVKARAFSEPRGRRSPIDLLFRSVAACRRDGVALVLSGSGSDGALGVRAMKEAGAVVFAQEPSEAEYPMMPENAIATGVVDFVAPIAELTVRLAEMAHRKMAFRQTSKEDTEQKIRQIVAFLRRRTGHDFSNYKAATITRRVTRRMQLTRQANLEDYNKYLQSNEQEARELLSDLLISVTSFFRDPEAFSALDQKVVKPLFDKLDGETSIRVWVVGCATGEEAYSIGILLLEEASRRGVHPNIQIFASDIDDGALATAREGRYPKAIESEVSDERLRRFFVQDEAHYRLRQELRELVLFASHSALKDPPFIKVDFISCRNLLIYLQRELQQQLCALFHYALKPNGFIFLGSAETIDAEQTNFSVVDREARIYLALGGPEKIAPILPQLSFGHHLPERRSKPQPQAELKSRVRNRHAAALEKVSPPSVLVDRSYRILHLSPTVGRFFRPSEGPFSPELADQVRAELRADLNFALQRALEHGEATLSIPAPVAFDGEYRLVALHVTPSTEGDLIQGSALVFFLDLGFAPIGGEDAEEGSGNRDEVARLRQQLMVAQDQLNVTRKEYERAAEESRAANEELQSINEEYRSTAEELETSKEELQSMNEELQTVNAELKIKFDLVSSAHNDLQNLVAATEIGTLFLDADLRIKFFTPRAVEYFNITSGDIGRVISDFTHRLVYNNLAQDVAGVLQNLIPIDKEVTTTDERWLSLQIRPYRTLENRIDGAVVTLNDVTTLKLAEQGLAAELRAMTRLQQLSTKAMQADQLEAPLGAILEAIVELLGADFGSIQLCDEACKTLHIVAHYGLEKRFLDHFATVDATSASPYGLALARSGRVVFEDVENEPTLAANKDETRAAGYRAVVSIPLFANSGKIVGMLAAHFREPHQFSDHELRLVDICARQAADAISVFLLQQALREADHRKDEFLAMLAHELRNPLTPIHNAVAVLKQPNISSSQAERLHDMIERQASHLTRLVDDLLDIARITRGKIELRRQSVDLNDVIRQAIETVLPLVEAKQQEIKISLLDQPLIVEGDFVRLAQVFSNLLNNASKFTPERGRIEVSTTCDGGNVRATVCDNGTGFSANSLAHVFELFNQGDHPSGQGQTGIGVGLALARGIVEMHGGTIEAYSEGADKGCEMRVCLPLSTSSSQDEAPSAQTRLDSGLASGRVLIVDDQQDVAESLAMLVQSFGVDARTAYDAPAALTAISEFKPEKIIMDLGLPGMDGFELAREVRKLVDGQNLVLIALSGWGQEEVRQRALKAGFDQFFVKPLGNEVLKNLLQLRGAKSVS